MNVQSFEQSSAQKPGRLIQTFCTFFRVTFQQTEKYLGMRVIRRDLDGLNGNHPHPRVFKFARDQFGQITLDLIGNLKAAIGGT